MYDLTDEQIQVRDIRAFGGGRAVGGGVVLAQSKAMTHVLPSSRPFLDFLLLYVRFVQIQASILFIRVDLVQIKCVYIHVFRCWYKNMCVYVSRQYAFMSIHAYLCTYHLNIYEYVVYWHTYIYIYLCMHKCVYTNIGIEYVYTYTYIHMCVNKCICTYTYIYVCKCINREREREKAMEDEGGCCPRTKDTRHISKHKQRTLDI